MTLPMSRQSAPGLHIAIAAYSASREAFITRTESLSTLPTGYVSFRSAWKPGARSVGCPGGQPGPRTVMEYANVCAAHKHSTTARELRTRTNVDDVTLDELPLVGDPVADDFID
jgi:hypothetical protein